MKSNKKLGFSVMDLILIVLGTACILTAVFSTQIRAFLGREERVSLTVSFVVENVTEKGKNHPAEREEMYLLTGGRFLGTIQTIEARTHTYRSEDGHETIALTTLQCTADVQAILTEAGYLSGETYLRKGTQLAVRTDTSSFEMVILDLSEEE